MRKPVDPATVASDMPLHLMRFVMMEPVLPRADVLAFLADLRDALAALLDGLEEYVAAAPFPDRHSPLALDHGIAVFAASLAWTKRTINALARAPADPAGSPPWRDAADQDGASPGGAPLAGVPPQDAAATRSRDGH